MVHIQCQASIYTLLLCRGHSWRVRLAKQETPTPPGHLVSPLICRGPWISTVVLYCWCHSNSASVLLYFTLFYCVACIAGRYLEILCQLSLCLSHFGNSQPQATHTWSLNTLIDQKVDVNLVCHLLGDEQLHTNVHGLGRIPIRLDIIVQHSVSPPCKQGLEGILKESQCLFKHARLCIWTFHNFYILAWIQIIHQSCPGRNL